MIKERIIIFGASVAGRRFLSILRSFNILVDCFIDNDKNKWGLNLDDVIIKSPEYLKQLDVSSEKIVIASMYADEISNQLEYLGFKKNMHFYLKEDIILRILQHYYSEDKNCKKLLSKLEKQELNNDKSLMIVLPNGFTIGGIETYSINLFLGFLKSNKKCIILNLNPKICESTYILEKKNICNFDFYYDDFIDSIERLILTIHHFSKLSIIPNSSEEILMANFIIDFLGLERKNILFVVHSDLFSYYEQCKRYDKSIDKFICVSDEIKGNIEKLLPLRVYDIDSKISPIKKSTIQNRKYSRENQPIKLGYVARLIRKDKRSQDIIPFLQILESQMVEYELHIVGDGECFYEIESYVKNKGLSSKVKLYGQMSNDKIYDFWMTKDIYINFSEREGTSISMLEALANACVPILTNVSGVKKFVRQKYNGFIVEPGELIKMVKYIKYFYNNKDLLSCYGTKCRERVEELCSAKEYIEYIWSNMK